jgi:hypothetical protein
MWSERATAYGLESRLGRLERMLDDTAPAVVALDAIASLGNVGSASEVASAVTRELDMLKVRGITAVLTTLTHDVDVESSALAVSSLIDTWLLVRNVESDGERNRLLFVIKSRGTEHSNQVREFVLTKNGAELLDVCVGPQGVVTGSARVSLEAGVRADTARREQDIEVRRAACGDGPAVRGSRRADRAAAGQVGRRGWRTGPADRPGVASRGSGHHGPHGAGRRARRWRHGPTGPGGPQMTAGGTSGKGQAGSDGRDQERFELRLYVAGQSPKSVQAIENLRRVCEEYLPGRYNIELIDLVEHPRLARGNEIIAVPTLVRRLPEPMRKIIGDLSDTDTVLVGLQIRPKGGKRRE